MFCCKLWHGLLNERQRDVGVVSGQLLLTLSDIAVLGHVASFRSQPSSGGFGPDAHEPGDVLRFTLPL